MRKSLVIALLVGSTLLSACQRAPVSIEEPSTEQSLSVTLGAEILATETDAIAPNAVFDLNQRVPVIADNDLLGYLAIKQITKVGVYDWYDSKVSKNINYSYSLGVDIDLTEFFKSNDEITLECSTKILDKSGQVMGKGCKVGWTGYDSVQQFFSNDTTHHVEFGLQPYDEIPEDSYVVISIKDPQNKYQFNDIYYSSACLQQAVEGNTLLKTGDSFTIESINGAKYTIKFNKLFYEKHKVFPVNGENFNNLSDSYFYDFSYSVAYDSAPTNDRQVGMFDSFHDNKMISLPTVRVYADNCDTPLETRVVGAKRVVSKQPYKEDFYLSDSFNSLDVGYYTDVIDNRLAVNQSLQTKYVRFVFEFPDEFEARTDSEWETFNGKFLVFQIPIEQREVE